MIQTLGMAEKPAKRMVAIAIKRERLGVPKLMVATGFRLRTDKSTGLIEVLLEGSGQKGERVALDPVLMRTNLEALKQYAANVSVDQDDGALKEDVASGDLSSFANIVNFSQMGGRAETAFGVFSVADWVEATRQTQEKEPQIKSFDTFVVMSTAGLQKKLLLELILAISQQS